MLLDAFLVFGDPDPSGAGTPITGETTEADSEDAIEILSFEHTVSRDTTNKSSAANAPASVLSNLRIIKIADKATPQILKAACEGWLYETAMITLWQPKPDGSEKYLWLEITLTKVRVDRFQIVGDPTLHLLHERAAIPLGTPAIQAMGPLEMIHLNFDQIDYLYQGADGSEVSSSSFTRP